MTYYTQEETLLSPNETKFRLEAWIMNPHEANKPDFFDEYKVEFEPVSYSDYAELEELVSKWCNEVEWRKSQYSEKEVRALVRNKRKFFISSQLFPPKTNVEDIYGLSCNTPAGSPQATITGHFRDLPRGEVVINIDYIDYNDPNNGIELTEFEKETAGMPVVDIDDDW